jgi:hypothetical protein
MTSAQIEDRGRGLLAFCNTVRERGEVAEVEEREDLPALRAMWIIAKATERVRRAALGAASGAAIGMWLGLGGGPP